MQYVGQTEVAGTNVRPGRKRSSEQLTQEESLVGVAMNQALDRRVGRLMEGVKGKLGVIRDHPRLHREELSDDGIVPRILPVDSAENIRTAIAGSVQTTLSRI